MDLPLQKVEGLGKDPKLLIIAGFHKSGKTTALAALEDNLIVDLEGGCDYLSAMKVRIDNLREYSDLVRSLQASEHKYRFISIDTGTKLEDIAIELAVINHQRTPIGKRWTGQPRDILLLANGLGYGLLRNAYLDLIGWLKPFCRTLILSCHIKNSSMQLNGEEIAMIDINLTGQLKSIMAARADAVGMFYRKRNQSILSFKGGESFLVEARPSHLRGREFVLIESDDEDNLTIDLVDRGMTTTRILVRFLTG
jgi:hypothetical protein